MAVRRARPTQEPSWRATRASSRGPRTSSPTRKSTVISSNDTPAPALLPLVLGVFLCVGPFGLRGRRPLGLLLRDTRRRRRVLALHRLAEALDRAAQVGADVLEPAGAGPAKRYRQHDQQLPGTDSTESHCVSPYVSDATLSSSRRPTASPDRRGAPAQRFAALASCHVNAVTVVAAAPSTNRLPKSSGRRVLLR